MKDETVMLSVVGLPEAVVTAAASMVAFEQLAPSACVHDEPRLGHEGDLVVLAVSESNGYRSMAVQNATGRIVPIFPGSSLIGVLGMRQSTGQAMGQVPTEVIGRGSRLHLLSEGGVVGLAAAGSSPVALDLLGFLTYEGAPVNLSQWGAGPVEPCALPPAILVGGTATGIGKTTLACRIIHLLARDKTQRVASIMLSGSGGKADTLAHRSAGARIFHSFIEAGLCNSYGCSPERYVSLVDNLCYRIAQEERPSVLVGEMGGDLLWGNNEVLLRRASFMHNVACLFVVSHDTLGAFGATQVLRDWKVNVPLRYVVSWTQNHGALALRFKQYLQQDLVDSSNERSLVMAIHHARGRTRGPAMGEIHA